MTYTEGTASRPVVGISTGDINGIGPEIIMKTLSDSRINKICTPVVYGSLKLFTRWKKILNIEEDAHFHQIKNINEINHKKVNLITIWEEDVQVEPGKNIPLGGQYALKSLEAATNDLVNGKIDALVTAPLNKENIQSAEFKFPGHTEYLQNKTGAKESLMLMVNDDLRVGVVTGHIPLKQVSSSVTKEKLITKIDVLYKSLKNDFQITKPKIAVLGLNPHAGENGLLGSEEKEVILPLVQELKKNGLLIFGPWPADAFFGKGLFKEYDAVLAMYHDQGLTPFKTMAFERGVNFTAGLPVVRTSPDHGTAYDIAGKGIADETSFRSAMFCACDIIKNKKLEVV